MPLPRDIQADLAAVSCPAHAEVVARANEFMGRGRHSAPAFAAMCGVGASTLRMYLDGEYGVRNGHNTTRWMDARIWRALQVQAPLPPAAQQYGRVLPTATFRKLHTLLGRSIREGCIVLVYGPPASEKSFVLENLVAQRAAAGKRDALYIYCDEGIGPLELMRRIAREAQVWIRAQSTGAVMQAVLDDFAQRPAPPAIVLDEAQHAPLATLEILRGLHDRSRRGRVHAGDGGERAGSGLLLAGSHDLYAKFTRPSNESRLAQWTSRIDHREQLPGMTREEALEIAAREMGNGKPAKLTAEQRELIITRCTRLDAYATDKAGKPAPTSYISARALVKYCQQMKRKREAQ